MSDRKAAFRGMAAAIAANVIWGFGAMFSRIGLALASPAVLMLWRFVIALLVLTGYAAVRRVDLRLKGRPWKYLLLMGIFEPGLYFAFEQYGILLSSASFAGVMLAMAPVAGLIFGAVFLRERPTGRQILFCLLSIAGVVLLSVSPGSEAIATPVGALCLVGAILSGSAYYSLNRRLAASFTPFERTFSMAVLGVIFFFVWGLLENLSHPAGLLEPLRNGRFVVSALYLGIGSTAVCYVLISYSANFLTVARSAVFNNIYSIVAILAGIAFLHEPFLPLLVPCTVMILAGVWGVQRFARDRLRGETAE